MKCGTRRAGRVAAVLLPFALAACQSLIRPVEPCGLVPACEKDQTLEAMACDIDHIEKHVDLWGSITTKHPDVWGAARMTKYQQDVERVFANELVDLKAIETKVTAFQGARSRTDQAFLAQAVAINAAISGKQAAQLPPDPITVVTGTQTTTSGSAFQAARTAQSGTNPPSTVIGSPLPANNQNGTGLSNGSSLSGTMNSGTDNKQTATTQAPTAVGIPTGTGAASIPSDFTTFTTSAIKQNPPVSGQLPGFGSAALQLEPTVVLDEKKRFLDHLNEIRRVNEGDDTADSAGNALYLVRVPVSVLPGKLTGSGHGAEITMSVKPVIGDELLPSTFRNLVINDMVDQFSELLTVALNTDRKKLLDALDPRKCPASAEPSPDQKKLFDDAIARVQPKATAARPSRNAEYAFPMTHVQELFGGVYVKALLVAAVNRYKTEMEDGRVIHLHDVRAVVREQVVAAYRFLATGNPHVWGMCTQDIARAVRDLNGNVTNVPAILHTYQKQYDHLLGRELGKEWTADSDRLLLKALGWGILLESALLTDLLVRDMKETASNKGCACPAEGWQDYFHPDPSPAARRAFNDYVTCRWPIYTFAVDPVTEQQNIQDTLSQRREMQLALSLAFASGAISAQSMTRFARRLEADFQDIELNRTVVGFSHGDSTFGWRFYPRFQTPEIPGNLTVLTRDLIGGRAFTKRQEIRDRRLEPGQRECVALVIMPSFIPYAEINISSSWFNLNDPKCKNHSTKETVRLSQRLHAIEKVCPKGDQDRYLAGEFGRLQAKARMLTNRLPLQDMKFPVPYENTLGGFELFNSGVTDLTPQLRGWYGAPGYDGSAVQLFLMGDHFSVVNTTVIAGGRSFTPNLISRQVLSVTLPTGLTTSAVVSEDRVGLYSETGRFVDVRVATPSGDAGPLRIPVLGPRLTAPPPVLDPVADGQTVAPDADTIVVLTGKNFTADAQVFAGGKACTVEVVGPTVLKVTVPKGAATLKPSGSGPSEGAPNGTDPKMTPPNGADPKVAPPNAPNGTDPKVAPPNGTDPKAPTAGQDPTKGAATQKSAVPTVVELKAVTVSGASNAIMVPVGAKTSASKAVALNATTLTLAYQFKAAGDIGIVQTAAPNQIPPQIQITLDAPTILTLKLNDTDPVTVTFKADAVGTVSFDVNYKSGKLDDISAQLVAQVMKTYGAKVGPENTNPPAPISLTGSLQPKKGGSSVDISDNLTIQWVNVPAAAKSATK